MNKTDLYATSSNASKVQVCFTSETFAQATERGGQKWCISENEHLLSITAHRMEHVAQDGSKKQSWSITASKQRFENLENQATQASVNDWIRAGKQEDLKSIVI